jgi:unsaturated rhamnogalacturonyl hydrolase
MSKPNNIERRQVLKWTAAGIAATASGLLPEAALAATTPVDWSQRIIDTTLHKYPDPAKFGAWQYPQGLYLMGQYLVYRRTGQKHLLDYIMDYVHAHISDQGIPDKPIESLDNVLAANLLVRLFEETRDPLYKRGADTFRNRFDTYPRTTDGGFWHGNRPERAWQLWLDGNYMAVPFLVRYGRAFNDSKYTNAEAVKQLLIYYKHLKSDHMGLLYHAWDESGKADWSDPVTHHSAVFWCRAIGWYGMAILDTLDVLPHDQPGRAELIQIIRELVVGLAHYQDKTGLWYQVVDKPTDPANWLETSSSSMFTYIMSVAAKRGYIASSYKAVARKGYNGVLSRITMGDDGFAHIAGICVGTNVGDFAWYYARPRATDDPHGLGAFLLMNEEWNTSISNMKQFAPPA